MKVAELPRDYILSFFVRPGRVISPAAVSEIHRVRPDILPAPPADVQAYITRRLNEGSVEPSDHGFGPTSPVRVQEILQFTRDGQAALPGLESLFAEFKREVPGDRAGRAKIAKALAAFANHQGGYVFFGIRNDGGLVGVPQTTDLEEFWDQLGDVITRHFTPFFRWERSVVERESHLIAVAYAYQAADRPIVATSDYTDHVKAGQIYFRYNRSAETISAGDLMRLLHERDRAAAANALASMPAFATEV